MAISKRLSDKKKKDFLLTTVCPFTFGLEFLHFVFFVD